ncbi:MAG TPA: restriction endonuclease subunit S, partial [Candidatus Rifleibacterium sp.]|nr:restriction endonuclease subunit S [Candidatus Rifleibacterium sp.]
PTKEKNMFDGEIPFITPGDLKESWVSAARTVTEDGAKKSRTVMKGATLVCCIGATIGKMGKAAEYAAFNQQINAISWGSLVEHNFGLEMMKFFKQKIALAGASTTLPILNKGLFKKISIPVPPLTLQNSFSKIIHSIEIQKKFFLEQLKTSNNLFASLMQRAFKGELELK